MSFSFGSLLVPPFTETIKLSGCFKNIIKVIISAGTTFIVNYINSFRFYIVTKRDIE